MTINSTQVAKVVLSIVACTLHSIGFWALWKVKQRNPFKVAQRLYLMNLSVAENVHSLFLALYNLLFLLEHDKAGFYMFICGGGGAFFWYMSVLIWLTLDRFLAVHLEIRYITVWGKSKTKVVLQICFWVAVGINILLCLYMKNFEQSLELISYYLWFPVDNFFILAAFGTYAYIMVRITKRKDAFLASSTPKLGRSSTTNPTPSNVLEYDHKAVYSREKSPNSTNDSNPENSVHGIPKFSWKTFLVPSLLILTFVIFIALPDNTYFCLFKLHKDVPAWFKNASFIAYPIGIALDAVIYILFTKDIRSFFMKKLKTWCSCFVGDNGNGSKLQQKQFDKRDYVRF